jgi:protein TonB
MSKCLIASCRLRAKWEILLLAVALTAAAVVSSKPLAAQAREQNPADRKVVSRVEPEYPETLKRLYIGGVVRVEAVVSPKGAVESTQLLGGSPILGQSAIKAIKQWKYEPATSRETLVVQLEFDPHR